MTTSKAGFKRIDTTTAAIPGNFFLSILALPDDG
jgi:hypothetical protein